MARAVNLSVSIKSSGIPDAVKREVLRALLERFADRCIVSSIHKLHLLEMFDEAYVVEDGRLVQHGPVKELLKTDGKLKGLWEAYNSREPDRIG